jgi:nitrogen fixation protein NifX
MGLATFVRKLQLVDAGRDARAHKSSRFSFVRIAIASQDGRTLNAHFGFARRMMIYDVTPSGHRLVQALTFASDEVGGEAEDRIGPKIAALSGCDLVFVLAIGPPAAARLIRANIQPIKVPLPEAIHAVISRVRAMMTEGSASWSRTVLQKAGASDEPSKEKGEGERGPK